MKQDHVPDLGKGLPSFLVPDKKSERYQWALNMVRQLSRYISNKGRLINEHRWKDTQNMELYAGKFETDEFKFITHTYKQPFPAPLENYTLLKPLIDRMWGEEESRPINLRAQTLDPDSINRLMEKKGELFFEKTFQPELEQLRQMGVPDQPIQVPDDINEYMNNFQELYELYVQRGLNYLIHRYDAKDKFMTGFLHALVMGTECFKVYIRNGDPYFEPVDKRHILFDDGGTDPYGEDSLYIGREALLTSTEIMERWGRYLNVHQMRRIEEIGKQTTRDYDTIDSSFNWITYDNFYGVRVRVWELEYKAIANLQYMERHINKDFMIRKIMDGTWKPRYESSVRERPYIEIWEGVNIGGEIFTQIRPRPNQPRNIDNYAHTSLSYVLGLHNWINQRTVSMVDLLKSVQRIYNIIIWNVFRLLHSAGGKAVIYDTSQIPDGYDIRDIMYHAKVDNFILINSRQEGNQMMSGSPFNQFQTIDFTLSASLTQYINLKAMCEDLAFRITGLNPARMGEVGSETLVGTQQRSIQESSLTTRTFFHRHSGVKRRVMQRLADLMKLAWKDGKKARYYLPDGTSELLSIPTGGIHDMGIFVMDGYEEERDKQKLQEATIQGFQTGNVSFASMVDIMTTKNFLVTKKKLIKEAERALAQQEKNAEQQNQIAQQANQLKAEADQQLLMLQQGKLQQEGQIAEMQNETKIMIQQMGDETKKIIKQMELEGKAVLEDMKQTGDQYIEEMRASYKETPQQPAQNPQQMPAQNPQQTPVPPMQ